MARQFSTANNSDSKQLLAATDAVAGIRHVFALMQGASEFHQKGALAGSFDAAERQIAEMQEKGEAMVRWLRDLYTRE